MRPTSARRRRTPGSSATRSSTQTSPTACSRGSPTSRRRWSCSTTTTCTRAPASSARRDRTPSCSTSSTSRGRSPTRGGSSRRVAREIYRGLLANDIIGFHHRLLPQLPALLPRASRARGRLRARAVLHEGRETWVRAYPLGSTPAGSIRPPARPEVAEYERELLRRRRDHMILRVDRADLSKNVLRGFTSFDVFLQQHPEFRERVRSSPPAALAPGCAGVRRVPGADRGAVRSSTTATGPRTGCPSTCGSTRTFEAVARYKHFDLLMVNSIFDGMNLVAKEAPAVNTQTGS